jgi:hypothetical protein
VSNPKERRQRQVAHSIWSLQRTQTKRSQKNIYSGGWELFLQHAQLTSLVKGKTEGIFIFAFIFVGFKKKFGGTGVWIQGLALARLVFYHLMHTPEFFFCFSYLLDRVSQFLPGTIFEMWHFYLCLLHNWDDKCIPPHSLVCWDGIILTFCPDWPQTTILQISASLGAEVADTTTMPRPLFVGFLVFGFFWVGLGFELRASHLHSRHSTSWATPPALFMIFLRYFLTYLLGLNIYIKLSFF